MIRAVLWDVDGTLAETERDGHRVAFNRAFAEAGLDWHWDEARYGRLLRVTGGRERLLADLATRADAPADPATRDALARTLHAAKNRHYAALVARGAIALRPGVAELLEDLAREGVACAIVTTTSRANVEALLRAAPALGGPGRFATIVCGEDVRAKKPDPEAYELALARLGLAPNEAVAVEDSPGGAASARLAGLGVVVTASHYFPAPSTDGAIAIGPGLHTRRGWRPAADDHEGSGEGAGEGEGRGGAASRVDLPLLRAWHASADCITGPA